MENRRNSHTYLVASLVFFGLTSAIAIFLLLIALLVWMTLFTGSLITASLIVGGFFAALSFAIYWLMIRESIHRFWDQMQTVYEVAHAAQTGYEWLLEKFYLFMNSHSK
ncbi:MAG: hypothetical protein RRZ83_06960 [Alistipes sp.]